MPKMFSDGDRAELESMAREMELTLQAVAGLDKHRDEDSLSRRCRFYNVGLQVSDLTRRLFKVEL